MREDKVVSRRETSINSVNTINKRRERSCREELSRELLKDKVVWRTRHQKRPESRDAAVEGTGILIHGRVQLSEVLVLHGSLASLGELRYTSFPKMNLPVVSTNPTQPTHLIVLLLLKIKEA